MNKKVIFCEMEFWDAFSKSIPTTPFSSKLETWSNTYKFIQSSKIHLDISYSEIRDKARTDDAMLKLWKKDACGECEIIPERKFPNLDIISATEIEKLHNVIFFTAKGSQVCESLSSKYGILALNVSKVLNSDFLFKDCGEPIKKNSTKITSWNYFNKRLSHPCNSLIIIDNFIVQRDSVINTDLRDLLDSILPKHLEVPFDLAIFCKEIDYGPEGIKSKYNRIWDILKGTNGIRQQLEIRLSLYKTHDFHDRAAVSNYLYIESGAGFDGCGKTNTTVKIIYPMIQSFSSGINEYYWNILRTAFSVRKKSKKGWDFEGDETNRLIDCGGESENTQQ